MVNLGMPEWAINFKMLSKGLCVYLTYSLKTQPNIFRYPRNGYTIEIRALILFDLVNLILMFC